MNAGDVPAFHFPQWKMAGGSCSPIIRGIGKGPTRARGRGLDLILKAAAIVSDHMGRLERPASGGPVGDT
jgi:hypothetical protein